MSVVVVEVVDSQSVPESHSFNPGSQLPDFLIQLEPEQVLQGEISLGVGLGVGAVQVPKPQTVVDPQPGRVLSFPPEQL